MGAYGINGTHSKAVIPLTRSLDRHPPRQVATVELSRDDLMGWRVTILDFIPPPIRLMFRLDDQVYSNTSLNNIFFSSYQTDNHT